jgi:pimeloyl-ACP methyl ester carboxylesterase
MRRLVPSVFRNGSVAAPLPDHLAAVQLRMPPLATAGRYSVTARTMVGDVEAGLRWRPASSANRPVLIFHHGLGEIPHDHTFRFVFRRRLAMDAHLVAIRAPFHRSHVECCRGLATLDHFMAMCAVSVTLMEAVRQALLARGARSSLVAGISFGGFLTLLHHLTYGTATRYAPLLAGPDLAYALLSTPCRGFLSRKARIEPADLTDRLDLRQAFQDSNTQRVFPLLARHDLWMPFAYHQAVYAASGAPVAIMNRGHMTGSWAFAQLRAHLLAQLRDLDGAEEAGKAAERPK